MREANPWQLADQKTVSLLYLRTSAERREIINNKNLHIMVSTLSTAEFCKIVNKTITSPRNVTFDRYVFLITKQLPGETVEHFYGKLKEVGKKAVILRIKKKH